MPTPTTPAETLRAAAVLLADTERYLSALHGAVARHDNLGADLTCAGCQLRDRITPAVASAVQAEAVPDNGLRDRIRRAICEASGFDWDPDTLEPDEYGDHADAVLAVLPAPADRAAEVENLRAEVENGSRYIRRLDTEYDGLRAEWAELRAEVDRLRAGRAAAIREAAGTLDARASVLGALSSSSFGEESYAARELTDAANRLRRLADEAQQPTVAEVEPVQLRLGLGDTEVGDDGTATLMLSGPDGAPYLLELDTERAAALRDDLGGPGGAKVQPEAESDDTLHACPGRWAGPNCRCFDTVADATEEPTP